MRVLRQHFRDRDWKAKFSGQVETGNETLANLNLPRVDFPRFNTKRRAQASFLLLALLASCDKQNSELYSPKFGSLNHPVFPLVGEAVIPEEHTLKARLARQRIDIDIICANLKPELMQAEIQELRERIGEQVEKGKSLTKSEKNDLYLTLLIEITQQFSKYDQLFEKFYPLASLKDGLLPRTQNIADDPNSLIGLSQSINEDIDRLIANLDARFGVEPGVEPTELTQQEKALKYPTSERLREAFGSPLDLVKVSFKRLTGSELPDDIQIRVGLEQVDSNDSGIIGRSRAASGIVEVSVGNYFHQFLVFAHEIGHLIAPLSPDLKIPEEEEEYNEAFAGLEKAEEIAAYLFPYAMISVIEDPKLRDFAFKQYTYECDLEFLTFCQGRVTSHTRAAAAAATLIGTHTNAAELFNYLVAEPFSALLVADQCLFDAEKEYWRNLILLDGCPLDAVTVSRLALEFATEQGALRARASELVD